MGDGVNACGWRAATRRGALRARVERRKMDMLAGG